MERLKELRQVLDINQTDFAAAIATTQGHLSEIENGRKALTERTIKLICAEFNVCEEWLRSGKGEMFNINIADEKERVLRYLSDVYKLDDIDKKWLDIVLSLPPSERGQLKRLALRLAEAVAELSDMEAAEEIVANAQAAHNEMTAEWNRGLTLEEEIALVYKRHEAAKKGAPSSSILEKHGQGATRKVSG